MGIYEVSNPVSELVPSNHARRTSRVSVVWLDEEVSVSCPFFSVDDAMIYLYD